MAASVLFGCSLAAGISEQTQMLGQTAQDLKASAAEILAVAQQTEVAANDEAAAVDETRRTMHALLEASARERSRNGGRRRLIYATNHNVPSAIWTGPLRREVPFRVDFFSVALPPLRSKGGEVPAVARRFVRRSIRHLQRAPPLLSPPALW